MGVPPQRIDILTSITGVEFDEAWPARLTVQIDGLSIDVLGIEQLYANKSASGRPKDQLDAKIIAQLLG
jgi:hypothetical protein